MSRPSRELTILSWDRLKSNEFADPKSRMWLPVEAKCDTATQKIELEGGPLDGMETQPEKAAMKYFFGTQDLN